MKRSFLAGLNRADFLRRHWQKTPLLARDALRDYCGAVTRDELFALAAREDVESRIVTKSRGRWRVRHGPFAPADVAALPRAGWTLLVQGVDLSHAAAARLLREFSFIPAARLDDVMVSYAAPGGGVGAHFDSYDVFLIQSEGRRRWQIGPARDHELMPGVPIRIVQRFKPQREWIVEAGDVLYLPPQWVHDGVAIDECITYSVGFRAPAANELAARFLDFLQDKIDLEGRYTDPELRPTRRSGRLPSALLTHTVKTLKALRWSDRDTLEFLGRYLTEPKEHVVFDRPRARLTMLQFARRAGSQGLRLSAPSRMLYRGSWIFLNGEGVRVGAAVARVLSPLADLRALAPPVNPDAASRRLLYDWYLAGYIEIRNERYTTRTATR